MGYQSINNGNGNKIAGRDIYELNFGDLLNKRPSVLARVISNLSISIDYDLADEITDLERYAIEKKIDYNKLVRYRGVIDEYGYYGSQIESVCTNLDSEKPNTKKRLLDYIKSEYVRILGSYCNADSDIETVLAQHSDDILDDVYQRLHLMLEKVTGLEGVDEEDIRISLLVLISKAFIDCKILEKPPHDYS